jgi:hypothetical protein
LLTDLAHNLLAWSRDWLFRNSPVAKAGIYRIVKELFPIPGKVRVEEGPIVKRRLKASQPFAKPRLACLKRGFDLF